MPVLRQPYSSNAQKKSRPAEPSGLQAPQGFPVPE